MAKVSKALMADGLTIAYQEWGRGGSKKVLALHGWMDNSNSFSYLGPYLAERDYHVAAVDLLGHGHSSHVPKGYMGHFQKYVYHSKGISELLGWEKMHIIGHSMSSGVAVMFSGTFPELFEKVVLIDILGPLAFPSDRATKHLRTAILAEDKYYSKGDKPGKVYESLDAAIAARVATVSTYPGTQTLSREAAHQLLLRGCVGIEEESDLTGQVRFCHDPKLLLPSYSYLAPEQAYSFYEGMESPTLLVTGGLRPSSPKIDFFPALLETGWPVLYPDEYDYRKGILERKGLLTHVHTSGSHHLHLDPESAPNVAQIITNFLEN